LRDGNKYSGIFSACNLDSADPKYTLKMVRKINLDDSQTNGASDAQEAYVGNGPDFVKTFAAKDVIDLAAQDVRFDQAQRRPAQNGASRFKTDTDISSGFAARERALQPWEAPAEGPNDATFGLDSSKDGQWDQFAANEKLFGVKTNFDESYYTTTIDRSHPQYKEREAKAERLAREIEGASSSNPHVAEERNQKAADETVDDEEAKYAALKSLRNLCANNL
jgi:PAB1-binding protein PBP1